MPERVAEIWAVVLRVTGRFVLMRYGENISPLADGRCSIPTARPIKAGQ